MNFDSETNSSERHYSHLDKRATRAPPIPQSATRIQASPHDMVSNAVGGPPFPWNSRRENHYNQIHYNKIHCNKIHCNKIQCNNQSHIAKHGVPKGLAAAGRPPPTLLAAAANGRRLHVLLYDFVDMSEDSLVCICICLCMYIRIYYYYY